MANIEENIEFNVKTNLDAITKKLDAFNKKLLNFKTPVTVKISKIEVDEKKLKADIKKALSSATASAFEIKFKLNKESISSLRSEIKTALNQEFKIKIGLEDLKKDLKEVTDQIRTINQASRNAGGPRRSSSKGVGVNYFPIPGTPEEIEVPVTIDPRTGLPATLQSVTVRNNQARLREQQRLSRLNFSAQRFLDREKGKSADKTIKHTQEIADLQLQSREEESNNKIKIANTSQVKLLEASLAKRKALTTKEFGQLQTLDSERQKKLADPFRLPGSFTAVGSLDGKIVKQSVIDAKARKEAAEAGEILRKQERAEEEGRRNQSGINRQLGFALLFGGPLTLAGASLGAALTGKESGALLGSQVTQFASGLASGPLGAAKEFIGSSKESALDLQKSIVGISAIGQSNLDVTNAAGDKLPFGQAIKAQQRRAQDIQLAARAKLFPLGIGGSTEATFVQGVTGALSSRGFGNATPQQIGEISRLLGGAISAQRPQLLDNPNLLLRDVNDLLSGGTLARRTVLSQLSGVKQAIPELENAKSAEDQVRILTKYLSEFADVAVGLDTPSTNLNKLSGALESLKAQTGTSYLDALSPAIKVFTDTLKDPEVIKATTSIGKSLGELTGKFTVFAADLAKSSSSVVNNFKGISLGDVATGAGVAGAVGLGVNSVIPQLAKYLPIILTSIGKFLAGPGGLAILAGTTAFGVTTNFLNADDNERSQHIDELDEKTQAEIKRVQSRNDQFVPNKRSRLTGKLTALGLDKEFDTFTTERGLKPNLPGFTEEGLRQLNPEDSDNPAALQEFKAQQLQAARLKDVEKKTFISSPFGDLAKLKAENEALSGGGIFEELKKAADLNQKKLDDLRGNIVSDNTDFRSASEGLSGDLSPAINSPIHKGVLTKQLENNSITYISKKSELDELEENKKKGAAYLGISGIAINDRKIDFKKDELANLDKEKSEIKKKLDNISLSSVDAITSIPDEGLEAIKTQQKLTIEGEKQLADFRTKETERIVAIAASADKLLSTILTSISQKTFIGKQLALDLSTSQGASNIKSLQKTIKDNADTLATDDLLKKKDKNLGIDKDDKSKLDNAQETAKFELRKARNEQNDREDAQRRKIQDQLDARIPQIDTFTQGGKQALLDDKKRKNVLEIQTIQGEISKTQEGLGPLKDIGAIADISDKLQKKFEALGQELVKQSEITREQANLDRNKLLLERDLEDSQKKRSSLLNGEIDRRTALNASLEQAKEALQEFRDQASLRKLGAQQGSVGLAQQFKQLTGNDAINLPTEVAGLLGNPDELKKSQGDYIQAQIDAATRASDAAPGKEKSEEQKLKDNIMASSNALDSLHSTVQKDTEALEEHIKALREAAGVLGDHNLTPYPGATPYENLDPETKKKIDKDTEKLDAAKGKLAAKVATIKPLVDYSIDGQPVKPDSTIPGIPDVGSGGVRSRLMSQDSKGGEYSGDSEGYGFDYGGEETTPSMGADTKRLDEAMANLHHSTNRLFHQAKGADIASLDEYIPGYKINGEKVLNGLYKGGDEENPKNITGYKINGTPIKNLLTSSADSSPSGTEVGDFDGKGFNAGGEKSNSFEEFKKGLDDSAKIPDKATEKEDANTVLLKEILGELKKGPENHQKAMSLALTQSFGIG